MFIYGELSNPNYVTGTDTSYHNRRYANFDLANSKTLEVKFATSYISLEQAKTNLNQEVSGDHSSFDSLHKQATNI
jgi:putative alpha-1,2-mannosidase